MTMPDAGSSSPATLAAETPMTLRPLRSHDDFAACVKLQRETWGRTYEDCVPASMLKVSQMVGGVSGGAFAEDGDLIGFVYGLTGIRQGRLIHWSHMLAVSPHYRNHGVGRRLKEYQRQVLRGNGIEMMYWTFDPLVARNAHLNLNRLGTRIEEYVSDMYGDTGSELHAFGTDRFVVSWPVSQEPSRPEPSSSWRDAPVLGRDFDGSALVERPLLRIEVPVDVESMPVPEAQAWRTVTRPQFQRLLGDGYRITGFVSEAGLGCYYLLARTAELP